MKHAHNTICPLCGHSAFVPHRFGLLYCADCSLVVDQRIFEDQLDQELNEEAFGESYAPYSSFWVQWFEQWKNRRYLANLRSAGVVGGRLLEVGVGSGSFLCAAREAGFDPMGCELSQPLAKRVQARTGISVYCGDLASLPKHAYNVVCMHHVLEHVSDPVNFLRAARERLVPGGILHIAVPNGGCWEARLPGWNLYTYYHLVYFDKVTLREALIRAGFSVRRMSSHDSFSAWFITIARTLAGVRSMKAPPKIAASLGRTPSWWPIVEHPYRLAMVISGVASWPLRWVQGRLGYGDELLVVAEA